MTIKLTETQHAVLSAATQREDRCLIFPSNLKGGTAQKISAKLIAAGLAKEINSKPRTPVWRADAVTGKSYVLKLTTAGAKAIATETESEIRRADVGDFLQEPVCLAAVPDRPDADPESIVPDVVTETAPSRSAPRGGTKLALVIELLRRKEGATIVELVAATNWLPHTTRAALTGLRKRGYAVPIDRVWRSPAAPRGRSTAVSTNCATSYPAAATAAPVRSALPCSIAANHRDLSDS